VSLGKKVKRALPVPRDPKGYREYRVFREKRGIQEIPVHRVFKVSPVQLAHKGYLVLKGILEI
jgi:hypothetical protein